MLFGWLGGLIMDGLMTLAGRFMAASEGRPVMTIAAVAFAFLVGLVVVTISIAAIVGFFWLVVWDRILSHLL